MLMYLTVSKKKRNVLFVDQTCTTYSSEERKLKKLLIVESELSINVKTKNTFKYDYL